jgi:hypothetical protein
LHPRRWRMKDKLIRLYQVDCVECGRRFHSRYPATQFPPTCSPACKAARRAKRRKVVVAPCVMCGVSVTCEGRVGLGMVRAGRVYCSESCKAAARNAKMARLRSRIDLTACSERMKARNPMHDPATKARMIESLRKTDWRPKVRGGNGQLTVPQVRLAEALGWPTEVVVRTGCRPKDGSGCPTCYKLDIGNASLKVGVEVDGETHRTVAGRARDAKKDACLVTLGWLVLRFSNREVMENLSVCVQTVLSTTSKSRSTTTISSTAS